MWVPDNRFEAPGLFYPARGFFHPVRINWDHPMARGLVFAYVPGPDRLKNLIVDMPPGEIIDNVSATPSERGQLADFPVGAHAIQFIGTEDLHSNSQDIAVYVYAESDQGGSYISKRDGNTCDWHLYSSNDTLFLRRGSSYTAPYFSAGYDLAGYAINHTFSGTSQAQGYKNGEFVRGSQVTGSSQSPSVPILIGARWNGYPALGYMLDGRAGAAFVWYGRTLSNEEHRSLHLDPYQFLVPA